MSYLVIDSITDIRDLEESLELQVKEARDNKLRAIKKAEEEAKVKAHNIIKDANNEAKRIIENKTHEAERISNERLEKSREEFEFLARLNDRDLKDKVDFVLERIEN